MIHMQKKNKMNSKPKWNRVHEFKRKKSNKKGVGHPTLVYGKSKRSYKYLLFTHTVPEGQEENFELLKHNIDPAEDGVRPSYMKKQYEINRKDAFESPDKKYRIHDDDKETVKQYKK